MTAFANIIKVVFGSVNVQWTPPNWSGGSQRRCLSLIGMALLGVLFTTGWSFRFWGSKEMNASISWGPPLNPDDPPTLVLDFDRETQAGAALPIISPLIEGDWSWWSRKQCIFTPDHSWAPGMKYTIDLDPNLAGKKERLMSAVVEIDAEALKGEIQAVKFVQDSKAPDLRYLTAKLKFNYPVNPYEVVRHVDLNLPEGVEAKLEGDRQLLEPESRKLRETVELVSAPLSLPVEPSNAILKLSSGVVSIHGGIPTETATSMSAVVPSLESHLDIRKVFYRVKSSQRPGGIIIQPSTPIEPEQLVGHLAVIDAKTGKAVEVSISDDSGEYPGKIRVEFTPTENEGYIVKIGAGATAIGGYRLGEDLEFKVDPVALGEPEFEILGRRGGIMSLTGSQKILVRAHGLSGLKLNLSRVQGDKLSNFLSRSRGYYGGGFSEPYLSDYVAPSMTRTESVVVPLDPNDTDGVHEINLKPFIEVMKERDPQDGTMMFFAEIQGWDPEEDVYVEAREPDRTRYWYSRFFVLLSDMAIIMKEFPDQSSEAFVMSVRDGGPVAGAKIQALAENGDVLFERTANSEGRVTLPTLDGRHYRDRRENRPMALMARLGDDFSFLPFDRTDLEHNQHHARSRYGRVNQDEEPEAVSLFTFTERGIYRPGDDVHVGLIARRYQGSEAIQGLPVTIDLKDTNDKTLASRVVKLPEHGFTDITFPTQYDMRSGNHYIHASIGEEIRTTSKTLKIEEFYAQKLKARVDISEIGESKGWVKPSEWDVRVKARNLFGTAAIGNEVIVKQYTSAPDGGFAEYPGFRFFTSSRNQSETELARGLTDESGEIVAKADLANYQGIHQLRIYAEVFEKGSGQSVTTATAPQLVSSQNAALGFRANVDLRFVPVGQEMSVELLAIDPGLNQINLEKIAYRVVRRVGSNDEEVDLGEFDVSAEGANFVLPAKQSGPHFVEFTYDENQKLVFDYQVVGGDYAYNGIEDGELLLTLKDSRISPGGDLEFHVQAPFAGSGLVTIEREKVFAYQWFKIDKTSESLSIPVPEELNNGNAFVSVMLARDMESPELRYGSYASGVAEFTVTSRAREFEVELETPEMVNQGGLIEIKHRSDEPARMIVFGVDEGILQVTNYQMPAPEAGMYSERSLEVWTRQLLDQIMPDAEILSEFGGGMDMRTNPFRRYTERPPVYWSGVIETGPEAKTLTYDPPDSFIGKMRFMALAVGDDGFGKMKTGTLVRNPVTLQSNVLTFAAPGDEFDVSIVVGNYDTDPNNDKAKFEIEIEASEHVKQMSDVASLTVKRGREGVATVRFMALEKLGSGSIKITARGPNAESARTYTFSVRPPSPYEQHLDAGMTEMASLKFEDVRDLKPFFRDSEISVSRRPAGLADGLGKYLQGFPHGCTEQISSKMWSRLMMGEIMPNVLPRARIQEQLNHTCGVLAGRANERGGFGLWRSVDTGPVDSLSVYAIHLLMEADRQNFDVPADMLKNGERYLRTMVEHQNVEMGWNGFDAQAHAAYVLSQRSQSSLATLILNLRTNAEQSAGDAWKSSIGAVYLAACYQQVGELEEASKIIDEAKQKVPEVNHRYYPSFIRKLGILGRHFPDKIDDPKSEMEKLVMGVQRRYYGTYSAGYTSWALGGLIGSQEQEDFKPVLVAQLANGLTEEIEFKGGHILHAPIPYGTKSLEIQSGMNAADESANNNWFYQIYQKGFPEKPATEAWGNQLNVEREWLDKSGKPIEQAKLGESITVKVKFNTLAPKDKLSDVAITDLLPAGFMVVPESLSSGATLPGMDHVEVREDRVVIYGPAKRWVTELEYEIKPTARGEFVIPPVFAEAMYELPVKANGAASNVVVQ